MKTLFFLCAFVAAASASTMMRALTGERAGTCPRSSGMAGICVFIPGVNCLSDSECPAGKKCCSEGCGKVCKDAVSLTATHSVVHAGSCPAPTSEVGICVLLPNSCSADSECASDQKCCPEGCNRVCKTAIRRDVVG